jgi:predicted nucleic acid-binding protein
MIILDTNVLSALMRVEPEPKILSWLDRQPRTSIWTTSVTLLEIRFGLQILPAGRKRAALLQALELLIHKIDRRVAAFDGDAANHAADLMANRQKHGRPVDLRDTMIAGIVLARHASLATRNTGHFADIAATLIDPWV